jgi:hypothetical protein
MTGPVYSTLATLEAAFQSAIGTSASDSSAMFNAFLFVAALMWIGFQIFTGVGQYSRSEVGLLDLSLISIRTIFLVIVFVLFLDIV